MPRVSVVIPTYNRAALLARALDSVLAQTRQADEIIVVDDGSTDHTAALLARRYPQVSYVYRPNAGVAAARNDGIRRAGGDWIALLDSDDQWLPQKLAVQLAGLPASAVLSHTNEYWQRAGRRVNQGRKQRAARAGGWVYHNNLALCAISPSSALIQRALLQRLGGFDERLPACEDYDLWLRICARYPVHYLDQPLLIKHGGHADQLSRQHWGMDRFRIYALEKILADAALTLSEENRQATLTTLLAKLDVYLAGVRKRDRRDEAERYAAKRTHYARLAEL